MLIIPSLGLVTMAGNAPLKQKKPPLGWPDCPASSRGGVFFLYSAGGEFESRGLPKQSFLHLRNVIFILRLQVFLMSFRCSFFSEKKRFIQQKSRTEVRDFCVHLVCQRNLYILDKKDAPPKSCAATGWRMLRLIFALF